VEEMHDGVWMEWRMMERYFLEIEKGKKDNE
jgi:hypothetical protein